MQVQRSKQRNARGRVVKTYSLCMSVSRKGYCTLRSILITSFNIISSHTLRESKDRRTGTPLCEADDRMIETTRRLPSVRDAEVCTEYRVTSGSSFSSFSSF